jgi:flagellar biosynthesis chaperone FliJ
MATKSMLKTVTIKRKKNCELFISALENASNKSAKEVKVSKPRIATNSDVKKIWG